MRGSIYKEGRIKGGGLRGDGLRGKGELEG